MLLEDTENGDFRKNNPPHKYYIQNMLWVMERDFYFSTDDIDRAMVKMSEADSRITKEFENEFKSKYSSSKSIDWKDYALGKRR